MRLTSSDNRRTLMHLFLFTNSAQSPKLKTGYRYENKFWNPGFTDGFRQFCRYQYFCHEILYYLVSSYSPLFTNLLNQNLHKS